MKTRKPDLSEIESLELLPRKEAQKRAEDLLRTMLNTPPDPQTPKAKPKKRAK